MEEVVLRTLMAEKDAYMNVADILTADAFYDPVNAMIYEAISTLGLNQRPIDMMSVKGSCGATATWRKQAVRSHHRTDRTRAVGCQCGIPRQDRGPEISGAAPDFLRLKKIETEAFDESNDVDDLLPGSGGRTLQYIADTSQTGSDSDETLSLNLALEQIQTAANAETGLSGLQTSYTGLDKMTSGWQNSDLIIIAARPAMGKTAFVLSMAKNMAIDYNIPVAIFTLGMRQCPACEASYIQHRRSGRRKSKAAS